MLQDIHRIYGETLAEDRELVKTLDAWMKRGEEIALQLEGRIAGLQVAPGDLATGAERQLVVELAAACSAPAREIPPVILRHAQRIAMIVRIQGRGPQLEIVRNGRVPPLPKIATD